MAGEAAEFAEFHGELRAVAADLLARQRRLSWPALADAGWTGLEIPEEFGGAGATFAEVAVVLEEIGRAAASTALVGSTLATGVLKALSPSDSRDELLSGIAAGELRAAVVLDGFRLDDGLLDGQADFVPDAQGADRLLIVATDADGTSVLVDTAGLQVTPQPVLDETRALGTVTARRVAVADSAVLCFAGDAQQAVQGLRDRAAVIIASDSLGLAEGMLAATVAYVQVRHQFGRPIGSFQAVKHACADMAVALAVSRRLVTAAVAAAVAGPGPEATVAASMAKSHACTAAVEIAGKAMQLHGGIGYTWESGIHVYLKRAALNRSLFGSPTAHRQQLAQRYLTRS